MKRLFPLIVFIAMAASAFCAGSISAKPSSQSKAAKNTSRTTKPGKHDRANKLLSLDYIGATQMYTDGHYLEAMKAFQALDRTGMCCDMVHYYMALCCQRRNQMQWAIDNYHYVVSYSKDDRLRAYATAAANQLAHYQSNRTYEGNGNNFQGQSSAPRAISGSMSGDMGGGGGGGGGG